MSIKSTDVIITPETFTVTFTIGETLSEFKNDIDNLPSKCYIAYSQHTENGYCIRFDYDRLSYKIERI